jgi:hypothetical protein
MAATPRPIRLTAPGAGTGTGPANAGRLTIIAAEKSTHLFMFEPQCCQPQLRHLKKMHL